MLITAEAYYQEEEDGLVTSRYRASVHVDYETCYGRDTGRALARNLYHQMMESIPKGGKQTCG